MAELDHIVTQLAALTVKVDELLKISSGLLTRPYHDPQTCPIAGTVRDLKTAHDKQTGAFWFFSAVVGLIGIKELWGFLAGILRR